MKMHLRHKEILDLIKFHAGKPTSHTFLENYLGNEHPRYPISNPELRRIAKNWTAENRTLSSAEFADVVTALITGNSFTEKITAGILLDYASPQQRKFPARLFDEWLDHVEGWAEVDTLCTGKFALTEIPENLSVWSKLLKRFNKSRNIQKRRASLVLLCSPLSHTDNPEMVTLAFTLIRNVMHEKETLITKAISWLLRSMIKHNHREVALFLNENRTSLPAIAVRETKVKLTTGKKTK